MPYTPKLEEVSDELFFDNVLAIVKRDFKPALDRFYPLIAAGASLLDDSIARPLGTTVLHMDGFTTKPGAGDLFTIAGDAQVYQVISSTVLVGTDSDVTFQPGLKVAIPAADGNEVVTFSGLPDFTQRTVGNQFPISYPLFGVDPDRNGPQQSADGSWIEAGLKLNLFLIVSDIDAPTVTRKAAKYARAMNSILRNASVADYTANVPANVIFALTWETSYEYGDAGKSQTGYAKPVSFELLLKFNER